MATRLKDIMVNNIIINSMSHFIGLWCEYGPWSQPTFLITYLAPHAICLSPRPTDFSLLCCFTLASSLSPCIPSGLTQLSSASVNIVSPGPRVPISCL